VFTCPTVETERLILRPFRMDDVDAYTALLQTPEVRKSLYLPDDVGGAAAFDGIAGALGQWQLRNTGQWALEEKATGTFVGRAGSFWPNRDDWPGIELGWALHPQHWGKGYATEAGAAAREWVFANHEVDEIYSCILPENTASQNVAKRLGFMPWEERTFKSFPTKPHMIWRLRRADAQDAET
jgi:RimJ/RimL family protein N-acetyltransferase